jgi:YihY family inner membrane protein
VRDAVTRLLGRFDRFHQRHPVIAVPFAVFKRFGEHDGGRLAATVSYYSFFSVFPLLLVFVTILGRVLRDDPELREELLDGALGQIPVIGTQLAGTEPLPGSGLVLVVGLLTALWAGLGAVGALQHALQIIADVPAHDRGNFFVKKIREVVFLVFLGLGLAVSTFVANLTTLFDVGWVAGLAGLAATATVNAGLLLMMFRVLLAGRRPLRRQLPGVAVGAVLLVALQQLGSFIVRRYIAGASDTYGTFAIVIALLSWFYLLSTVVLMSAELNTVLADRLSPRRLLGSGPPTDADRRAALLDVQRVQRDPRLGYALAVDGTVATESDPRGEESSTADGVDRPGSGDVEVPGEPADLEQTLDRGTR